MPSGDLMVLQRDQHSVSCIRAGNLRWQYYSDDVVEEFDDHITGTRRMAVSDQDSTLYFLTSAGTSSTHAIDRNGKILWNLPWAGIANSGALMLDTRGHLFFTFQLYEIDHRSRGGVICISEK